ncbi:hypothetical protein NKH77_24670 [Streptomyces sp. M19]
MLDQAVTTEGVIPQQFKLQEWVDTGLLLAYRLPRVPVLSASLRLSVDPKARNLFGTRWPNWIDLNTSVLLAAQEAGELLPTSTRARPRGSWWAPGPAWRSCTRASRTTGRSWPTSPHSSSWSCPTSRCRASWPRSTVDQPPGAAGQGGGGGGVGRVRGTAVTTDATTADTTTPLVEAS